MKNMKVLLLNGSPRKEGCTFTALSEVAKTLNHNGIDTEIFQAGNPDTDNVKAAAAKLKEADALEIRFSAQTRFNRRMLRILL